MGEFFNLGVILLLAVLHVFFIVLALGMPLALWHIGKAGHWQVFSKWALGAALCIGMAVFGVPLLQNAFNSHIGNFGDREKKAPTIIAYVMAGFFGPMLIPEPLRWAKKRLRHERGGRRRRRSE
jgi:hypothetical protein